jgi:hypothetical protein
MSTKKGDFDYGRKIKKLLMRTIEIGFRQTFLLHILDTDCHFTKLFSQDYKNFSE